MDTGCGAQKKGNRLRRKGRQYLCLLALGLILELGFRPGLARGEEARIIREVRIEGTHRVDPDAVRMILSSRTGQVFSPEVLREEVKKIFALGYFDEAWVEEEEIPEGVILIFRVKERPWVREVSIEGKKKISEEKIKEVISVKPRQPLNIWAVEEDVKKIEKRYREEGYYHAQIQSRIVPVSEGEVKVVYQIQERRKVVVRKISFSGNAAFSPEELVTVMESQEYGAFSWLTGKGAFNREALDLDLERLRAHYLDWGYIQAKIAGPFLLFGPERDWVEIHFDMEEGEQFWVGQVGLQGESPLTQDEIMPLLKTKEGKIFSRSRLSEDIYLVTEKYADIGYALTSVEPLSQVDFEKRKVNINLSVDKGELVYVDQIRIQGNTKTRDKVIRRELRLREGQLFSGTDLRESRRRVYALGFFEDVNINTEPVGRDRMALAISVKERPTGSASAGIGYSSVDRLVGTAQLSFGNLMGRGQRLRFITEFGSRRQTFDLGFEDPYFLDTDWSLGANLNNTTRDYTDYSQTDRGGSIQTGYLVSENTRVNLSYRYDDVTLTNLKESVPWFFIGGSTSSMTLGVSRDTRDHPWDPTRGNLESASVEQAGLAWGGESEFYKFSLLGRIHFPLLLGSSLMLNGRVAYGQGFSGKPLPFAERYFVGGLNSVRGFDYRTLGPEVEVPNIYSDPASYSTQMVWGGNKMVVLNAELMIPLIKEAGIKGLVFFDAGNAYDESEQFFSRPLRMGYGFGFRWFSPIGPLRFEWGYPIQKKSWERASVFEFSIGTFF